MSFTQHFWKKMYRKENSMLNTLLHALCKLLLTYLLNEFLAILQNCLRGNENILTTKRELILKTAMTSFLDTG